ncbi:DNA gyrase inhibitor YacG [Zavarzinella formosa]|uniref:DNA gyrase inhibitor YacG n=1 Tax=Zavarzinella formosa TaxID=360055 RepID=UPI0002E0D2BE|nr:DNA gyrase inhibitor YacG [Zavarzinella formosa]
MKKTICPICEKAMPGQWNEWPEYPFCSKKCRTIDLGRWLGENYRVPSQETPSTFPDEEE